MIPVLDAAQMRAADRQCIESGRLGSWELMERAAKASTDWILVHEGELVPLSHHPKAYVVACGTGNNGGDGLAIARLLFERGCDVSVLITGPQPGSVDFQRNLMLLRDLSSAIGVLWLKENSELPEHTEGSVIIDAIFGTGLNKPIEGLAKEVVHWINRSRASVVAIDLPSGLSADGEVLDQNSIAIADRTLTLHSPKPAMFFRECAPYIGQWHVLPIGLDDVYINALNSEYQLIEKQDVVRLIPLYFMFAHKGDHGHALLITGSSGMMGAAVLATCAALRSGAGLTTTHVPRCGVDILQATAPEAICSIDEGRDHSEQLPKLLGYSGVGFGPGLGRNSDALIKLLIQDAKVPLVLDADALNALADNKTWLAFLPKGAILTPHPKEFDRLFGSHGSTRERVSRAREEALKRGCTIILKGAYTAVCAPTGKVHFNPTGDPGMAKGGSGDVLTGLLTGLLARGIAQPDAAILGVYIHGLAGELAAEHIGRDGMTAMDIVHHLPEAWRRLRKENLKDAVH